MFSYEGKFCPGKITNLSEAGSTVNVMEKTLKAWRWTTRKDEILYEWNNVVGSIVPQFYTIPQLENF